MAMRSALTSLPLCLRAPSSEAATGGVRLLSDGKSHVLSEEECAKESVYIQSGEQKMEKERQEKLKKRLEQERSATDKKAEGST